MEAILRYSVKRFDNLEDIFGFQVQLLRQKDKEVPFESSVGLDIGLGNISCVQSHSWGRGCDT